MNDEIRFDKDDLITGVRGLSSMAETYQNTVSVIASTTDQVNSAFGTIAPQLKSDWEYHRDEVWKFLADSQDNLNSASKYLSDYTCDVFDLDAENSETLEAASDFDKAEQPEEK